jgi:hypothetical protein
MEYTDILNVNLFDCAGYGISHKIGFDKKSSLKYKMVSYKSWNFFKNDVVLTNHAYDLSDDILFNIPDDKIDYVKNLAKTSTVIQFNPVISHGEFGELHADQENGIILRDGHLIPGKINWGDYLYDKNKFVLFNGSVNLLANAKAYYDMYKDAGFKILYSTPGYQDIMTDARWCPYIPYGEDSFWKSKLLQNKFPINICHSSTNDKIKNTEDLIYAVDFINKKYKKEIYKLHIIRYTPWEKCIEIKKSCQINFDHMQGYCGIGSLEGSKLGLINIVGVSDSNLKMMHKELGGFDNCPWLTPKNRDQLIDTLLYLMNSNINQLMKDTKDWAEETYNQKKLINRMEEIYLK